MGEKSVGLAQSGDSPVIVPELPHLQSRCEAVSNRSARVVLNLEKLAARAPSDTVGQMKTLASTVGDFVHEMDKLATLLRGATALAHPCRHHLNVLVSDTEVLADITSSVPDQGADFQGENVIESALLEKLVATEKTWKAVLQLVTSFQGLIRTQHKQDAAQDLDMTTGDFEELERLISRIQVSEPLNTAGSRPQGGPRQPVSADNTITEEIPDYETAVASSSSSPVTLFGDSKQQMPAPSPRENGQPCSSAPAPPKPKRGMVNSFFRSLSSTFTSPVEPLVTPLCQAAEAGDLDHVRGLVSQGANPNGVNDEGYTPLTSAIHSRASPNHTETVRFLLDSGASMTASDAVWSLPPLWHACRAGRADLADLLVSRGADVNGRSVCGSPYFFDSAANDPPHILDLLLERGADANTASLSGNKIVVSVVERGDMAKTRALFRAGAKPGTTTNTGHPLLAVAVSRNNLNMATFLLDQGAKADVRNGYGDAIVSLALAAKNADMVRLLLARGANPNGKSNTGKPSILSSIEQDLLEITRLLLDHGADPSAKDCSGVSVMARALIQNRYEHARILLERGAKPNVSGNVSGDAHLIVTLIKNHLGTAAELDDAVRTLLRHGSDPDLLPATWDCSPTRTPLGYCVKEGNTRVAKIMLENWAEPHRAGQSKKTSFTNPLDKNTPFMYAVSQGKAPFVWAMLDAGAIAKLRGGKVNVDEVLLQAATLTDRRDIVDLLLDEGIESPAYAVAFAERRCHGVLKAAVEERVRHLGLDTDWSGPGHDVSGVAPPPYKSIA